MEFNECARRAVSAMPGLQPDDGHHFLMRVSKDNIAQVCLFRGEGRGGNVLVYIKRLISREIETMLHITN